MDNVNEIIKKTDIKDITPADYHKFIKNKLPKTNVVKNCIKAFIVGGLICIVGQFISDFGKFILKLDPESLSAFVAIVLVFLGATFTGIGIYDDLGRFAGAGSIVPITGFANSIVSPAIEFKKEGLILGIGAKMFTIAGPVLVYGYSSSILFGIIYYFFMR